MTGEFALIERLSRHLSPDGGSLLVGHGDDAAVIDLGGRHAVLAVDALVEGRHWLPELSDPEDVGWKAVAVNCSDLAAMAAEPVAAVVALHRPDRVPAGQVEALYAGMAAAADAYGLVLAGGDTVASDVLAVSLSILGAVAPGAAVRRAGARPGDALVCVGALGEAAAGLAEARSARPADPTRADPALLTAHRRPRALLKAGRALADAGARAMIDVSDGLGTDLAHLCRASGVAATVRAGDLPVGADVRAAAARLDVEVTDLALGGEDLALVAAVPPDRGEEAVRAACRADGVPGAVIGQVVPIREPLVALESSSGTIDVTGRGYDHYGGGRRDHR